MYILSIAVLCGCLHLATSVPAQCEKAEIQTCGDKYKKAVRDGLGHCGRLQVSKTKTINSYLILKIICILWDMELAK